MVAAHRQVQTQALRSRGHNGGGRRVNERRRGVGETYNQAAAMQRVTARLDEGLDAIAGRVEAGFDRVNNRLDRMERDIAQGEFDRRETAGELVELRRDLGELRDAMNLKDSRTETAVEEVAKKIPDKGFWKTKLGMLVVICAGFTAIVTAAANVPKALRWGAEFHAFLVREPEPVVREKDKTDGE